jgi:phosphoenolpyruvate synthase/pyruvate phosphate dikinase
MPAGSPTVSRASDRRAAVTGAVDRSVRRILAGQQAARRRAAQRRRGRDSSGASWGAKLPAGLQNDLRKFLERIRYPLAVRSSSLLEDSQYQPFTGVYETYMLANCHPDLGLRASS